MPFNDLKHTGFLGRELGDFPNEFLLFTDHVNQLILENRSRSQATQRLVSRTLEDGFVSIFDTADRQTRTDWNVFTVSHPLSEEAQADANQPIFNCLQ